MWLLLFILTIRAVTSTVSQCIAPNTVFVLTQDLLFARFAQTAQTTDQLHKEKNKNKMNPRIKSYGHLYRQQFIFWLTGVRRVYVIFHYMDGRWRLGHSFLSFSLIPSSYVMFLRPLAAQSSLPWAITLLSSICYQHGWLLKERRQPNSRCNHNWSGCHSSVGFLIIPLNI